MNSGEAPPPGTKAWNAMGHVFNLPTKYQMTKMLGKTGHHPVCLAINKDTNTTVAIVKMGNAFDNFKDARNTYFMLKMLPLVDHKNIVPMLEIIPPQVDMSDEFYIVYETMSCDLMSAVYSGFPLSPKHVLYQILCALHYVHYKPPFLNNLNLNNVLLNAIDDVFVEVKISDYCMGHANPGTNLTTDYVKPTRYEAPEVLLRSTHLDACAMFLWSPGCMWSLGCIFMELLTCTPLFPGSNDLDALENIVKQLGQPTEDDVLFLDDNAKNLLRSLPPCKPQSLIEKFPDADVLAIDLVTKMIAFNPTKRISATAALNHPYLSEMHRILGPEQESQLLAHDTAIHCYNSLIASSYNQVKDMIFEELNSYKKKPHKDRALSNVNTP